MIKHFHCASQQASFCLFSDLFKFRNNRVDLVSSLFIFYQVIQTHDSSSLCCYYFQIEPYQVSFCTLNSDQISFRLRQPHLCQWLFNTTGVERRYFKS